MDDQDSDTKSSTEEVTTPVTTDSSDASMLLRIEEMIRTHISQIDDLAGKITEHKEMIDDVFKNSETFQEHDKIAKEATRIRSKTKQEIMKQPAVAEIAAKLKEMKNEKTELQEGLSDYLREYQRISGSNEIEGEDGEVREIVYVAKLVRKSKFKP